MSFKPQDFPPLITNMSHHVPVERESQAKKTTNYKEDTKKHILEDPLDY